MSRASMKAEAKRAAQQARSGKDAAAGEKQDDTTAPAAETPAPPKPDRMAQWAFGETKIAKVGDRALLKLAAQAVKGAAKRAKSLNAGLGIAKGEADQRMSEADQLLAAIKSTGNRDDLTVAAPFLRCAQVGVSFLIEKAVKMKASEEEDLGIEDTASIDAQLRALERLARDLGMQGQLWEEPEEKGEGEKSDQSDAFDQDESEEE